MSYLIRAKQLLSAGEYTCVLCGEDGEVVSTLRGVKPLVLWQKSGRSFSGFSAADKVVGRATAFLYALLGVKEVYTKVISEGALSVLSAYRISVEYETRVEHIVNRKGDGVCPFEAAVMPIEEKNAAYLAILDKMQELGILDF